MKNITILGSTGSIGKNTLNLIAEHPDLYRVFALTARSQWQELLQQCRYFEPRYVVLEQESHALHLQEQLQQAGLCTEVLSGNVALQTVASDPEVDFVMAAIVGAAGLLPTLAAAKSGKRILLANKEALVMSGKLFMDTVRTYQATLLPVDSEHNAIFQCMPAGYLPGESPLGVADIILTASGGPFRTLPLTAFNDITPEQAIAHPNWKMGQKISVDSASLMNKGFEVIEAHWLFNLPLNQIKVMIHPQSIIHSIVNYEDGSMLAQLGSPDMRTPIAYTLSWPERITTQVKRVDLIETRQLTFEPVDHQRFPSLHLAYQALQTGGSASTLLNAANEVAVAAFLAQKLRFLDIPNVIQEVLDTVPIVPIPTLESVLNADQEARRVAHALLLRMYETIGNS